MIERWQDADQWETFEDNFPDGPFETDKAAWGKGPWSDEPDRVVWRDKVTGLPCMIVRNHFGALCGYAAVPHGHPWFGQSDVPDSAHEATHAGITYAGGCRGLICHVPKDGEDAEVWWLGFDCSHAFDLAPGLSALLKHRGAFSETYRTIEYVRERCTALAHVIHEAW